MTREEFIGKAVKIHGNKYDYSKIGNSLGVRDKVIIICPEHGEFLQLAGNHLKGRGCKKCAFTKIGKDKTLTQEEFIDKAKSIYGEKYDLSLVEYVNTSTKIKVICPEHGEFLVRPSNFLNGSACKCCGREIQRGKTLLTQDEFIERAVAVHGNKYDYSKVIYAGTKKKVCIICPEHGEFWQKPYAHLAGQGCPKCANNQKIDKEEFIRRAREIHGDKYDYSKVDYKNNYTKVVITCPEHGDFKQFPHSHLQGNGCQKCYEEPLLEREVLELLEKNGILYVQQKKFDGLVYKRKLAFDFYLPEQNTAIECQGIQHFRPVEQFGGIDGFNEQVARDEVKRKFCDENGIKLLYYNHLSKIQSDYPVIHTKKKLLTEINDKDL